MLPRAIGLVTSPGAAALHDVVTALRRRVPHIPVVLVPALVQGAQAPASLCEALSKLYLLARSGQGLEAKNTRNLPPIDVILLVRGGGAIEDLWAFNDAALARTIVASPVPVISGVGHEPTSPSPIFVPTCARPPPRPRPSWLATAAARAPGGLAHLAERLHEGAQRQMRTAPAAPGHGQRNAWGGPRPPVARQQLRLARLGQRMRQAGLMKLQRLAQAQQGVRG